MERDPKSKLPRSGWSDPAARDDAVQSSAKTIGVESPSESTPRDVYGAPMPSGPIMAPAYGLPPGGSGRGRRRSGLRIALVIAAAVAIVVVVVIVVAHAR